VNNTICRFKCAVTTRDIHNAVLLDFAETCHPHSVIAGLDPAIQLCHDKFGF